MQSNKLVHIVSCHAEGEVGDVIVGGVMPPPGDTIFAQSQLIAQDGKLRDFVLNEPRGGVFRHVNLLVPPKHPGAHFGWIIMEPEDTPPMSGSNAICVATVVTETGMVPVTGRETKVILEAPGGLIHASVEHAGGRAQSVTIENVPSFVDALDVPIEVAGIGTVVADVAYGGDSFAIVDAQKLGFGLSADEARELAEVGMRVTQAVNEQYRFDSRRRTRLSAVSFCQMTAPLENENGTLTGLSAVAIRPGKIDRSPCGTGCSARMAVLHARGSLAAGQSYVGRSILGSRFECQIVKTIPYHDTVAIVASIRGRAWLTGIHQHMLDSSDPWPGGYRLSDTWPNIASRINGPKRVVRDSK